MNIKKILSFKVIVPVMLLLIVGEVSATYALTHGTKTLAAQIVQRELQAARQSEAVNFQSACSDSANAGKLQADTYGSAAYGTIRM